jgi:hypothetical protein
VKLLQPDASCSHRVGVHCGSVIKKNDEENGFGFQLAKLAGEPDYRAIYFSVLL